MYKWGCVSEAIHAMPVPVPVPGQVHGRPHKRSQLVLAPPHRARDYGCLNITLAAGQPLLTTLVMFGLFFQTETEILGAVWAFEGGQYQQFSCGS